MICSRCNTREAAKGFKSCEKCLNYGRVRATKDPIRRVLSKANGMCYYCHIRPRLAEIACCQRCREKRAILNRQHKARVANDPRIKEERRIKNNEYNRKALVRRRTVCFEAYGGKCVCCGELRWEFLTIDHVKGDGAQHRSLQKGKIHAWAIKNNFPDSLQLLCMNCNWSKGIHGYCPHNV